MNNVNSITLYLSEPLYFGGYYRVIFDGQTYDLQLRQPDPQDSIVILGNSYLMTSPPTGIIPLASNGDEEDRLADLPVIPFAISGYGDYWSEPEPDAGEKGVNTRSTTDYVLYAEEGNHTISIIRLQADIKTIAPEMLPLFYAIDSNGSYNMYYPGNKVPLLDILNTIEQRLASIEQNDPIQWVDYPAEFNFGDSIS